jgi:GMP synthase-like glutamine amidotransferase
MEFIMNNISITVAFGGNNSLKKDVPYGTTVKQILEDRGIQAALGFGTNVEARCQGVTVNGTVRLENGATVMVVNKACEKAA